MKIAVARFAASENLGDEIQTIAAEQIVRRCDFFVEREQPTVSQPCLLVCNGWWAHRDSVIPFSPAVHPFFFGFYIGNDKLLADRCLEYYRRYEPIGCRSPDTAYKLCQRGVRAYVSGCLSLCLARPSGLGRSDEILAVDVRPEWLPASWRGRARYLTHRVHSAAELRERALYHLRCYMTAQVVITSRLHAALPCVAYRTPVIFIQPVGDRERHRLQVLEEFVPLSEPGQIHDWSPAPPDARHRQTFMREDFHRRLAARLGGASTNPGERGA